MTNNRRRLAVGEAEDEGDDGGDEEHQLSEMGEAIEVALVQASEPVPVKPAQDCNAKPHEFGREGDEGEEERGADEEDG